MKKLLLCSLLALVPATYAEVAAINAVTPYYLVKNTLNKPIYIFEAVPQSDGMTYISNGWISVAAKGYKIVPWTANYNASSILIRDADGTVINTGHHVMQNCVPESFDVNHLNFEQQNWPVLEEPYCQPGMVAANFEMINKSEVITVKLFDALTLNLPIIDAYSKANHLNNQQNGFDVFVKQWKSNPANSWYGVATQG